MGLRFAFQLKWTMLSGQSGRLPSTADDTGLDEDLDLNIGPDSSVSAEDTSSVLTDLEQSDLELPAVESLNDTSELTSEVCCFCAKLT